MKKLLFIAAAMGLLISACLPSATQPAQAPVSDADLQATAAVLSQQTLRALASPTLKPSETPVVVAPTMTVTIATTPTATQNSALLSLTTTLTTGTVTSTSAIKPATISATAFTVTAGSPTVNVNGTLPFTITPNPAFSATPTETDHPQHYGTMPPFLPFGKIILINKSKSEVSISLQCTTKDGYTTIIETPVIGTDEVKAPAGNYVYVAWVGGKKIVGKFSLGANDDLKIKILKDHLEIGH